MKKERVIKEYSVPSLEKAFNLFDLLIAHVGPVSLSQLAKLSGELPSGIFRILNLMVLRGYVLRDSETGFYSISSLGKFISPVEHLKLVAVPMIEQFLKEAPYSCHLSILSGKNKMVIYNGKACKNFLQISVMKGELTNALDTHTGFLLLSRLDEKKLNKVFCNQNLDDEKVIRKKIEKLKLQRSIVRNSLAIDGIIDVISVGLPNSYKVLWAISCPIIKKLIESEESIKTEIVPKLEKLTDSIAAQFK